MGAPARAVYESLALCYRHTVERLEQARGRAVSALHIVGGGSDHELLLEEGLDKADAFVALTGNDEENILLSLFASASQVSKTITKVNRSALLKIAQQLGYAETKDPGDDVDGRDACRKVAILASLACGRHV